MAKKIRLIGLDLDGTALTNEKKMTDVTMEALEQVLEIGVAVVPATGRTLLGIPDALRDLPGIELGIVSNGAAVYDLRKGTCLYESVMPQEQAEAVVALACRYPISVDVFVGETGYLEESRREYLYQVGYVDEVLQYILNTHKWVPDLTTFVKEEKPKVQKIAVNFPGEAIRFREELQARLQEDPDLLVVCGGGTNLEITNRAANKGDALMWIAREMQIGPEEVMAIGDSENDLAMVSCAGVGIAMANAVPRVKAAADYVTESNENNGVARALEHYVLNRSGGFRAFWEMMVNPKEALFSPAIFAALTAVWGYAVWVLFLGEVAPLPVPFLGVVVGVRVLREWYLVACFQFVIVYLSLTPRYRSMPALVALALFPICLYGAVRLFCLGGIRMGSVIVLMAAALIGGGRRGFGREGIFRLQISLFLALFVAGALYVGSEFFVRQREAKPLVERGQSEYLLERNWDVLRPFEAEAFANATEEERVIAMQALADWEAFYLGLEPVTVTKEALMSTDKASIVLGTYQNTGRLIRMSEKVIARANRDECLEVLCHELYHAYQWGVAEADVGTGILPAEQVERWQAVLKGYKSNEASEYLDYYNQDAEATARKYAEIRSKELAAMVDCLVLGE